VKRPYSGRADTPSLITPDLERVIARLGERTRALAAAQALREGAVRRAWSSPGGRAFEAFVTTRPAQTTQRVYRIHLEDFLV
jgi:hypothetical protein